MYDNLKYNYFLIKQTKIFEYLNSKEYKLGAIQSGAYCFFTRSTGSTKVAYNL